MGDSSNFSMCYSFVIFFYDSSSIFSISTKLLKWNILGHNSWLALFKLQFRNDYMYNVNSELYPVVFKNDSNILILLLIVSTS